MLRHPLVSIAACVFAVAGNAQSDSPSLETGRRAARCSIVAGMAAKAARSPEAREGSMTMGRLMGKLARSASSPQQHIAWLDEFEVDLKAADASAMRAMTADCRALIGEQSEALDGILSSEK